MPPRHPLPSMAISTCHGRWGANGDSHKEAERMFFPCTCTDRPCHAAHSPGRVGTLMATQCLKGGACPATVSSPLACPCIQGAGKGKRIMGGKVPTESLVTPVDMVDTPAEPSGRGSEVRNGVLLGDEYLS